MAVAPCGGSTASNVSLPTGMRRGLSGVKTMSFDLFGGGRDLTEKQRCILQMAQEYPNASKEQIADHCNTSVGYVTETLRNFGDPWDFGL